MPLSPVSFLTRAATAFADKVAVIDGERRYTYADLFNRSARLATDRETGVAKAQSVSWNADNVTVLTSSQKDELSDELPAWRHGAFTQAFLDALSGAGDPEGKGVISVNKLADAMDRDLTALTKGKQHLGERLNFSSDLFVVSHW